MCSYYLGLHLSQIDACFFFDNKLVSSNIFLIQLISAFQINYRKTCNFSKIQAENRHIIKISTAQCKIYMFLKTQKMWNLTEMIGLSAWLANDDTAMLILKEHIGVPHAFTCFSKTDSRIPRIRFSVLKSQSEAIFLCRMLFVYHCCTAFILTKETRISRLLSGTSSLRASLEDPE